MDSSEKREYPRRMYSVVPQQNKSINHGCSLSILRDVRKSVGDEVWEYLKNSALGVLILLAESKFCWHSKTVHYFLTHQLKIKSSSEIWCLIGEKPLRFSLHEFAELSGLNCDPYNVEKEGEEAEIDHREIWAQMGVPIGDGPSWEELAKVLTKCNTWSYEKKRIVGCLCILSLGIFGLSRGCRMDLKCAKKALDPAALERFPWGRRSYELLIESIKEAKLADNTYTLKGLVHVLQIWAYESFERLGELYGRKKQEQELPILSWGGSRCRYQIDDIVLDEKKNHGQVRVRQFDPMVNHNKDDHKLDNLIKDIMDGKVAENAWSKEDSVGNKALVVVETVGGTSKRVRSGKHKDPIKKPRVEKRTISTVHENVDFSDIGDFGALVKALSSLSEKVDLMDSRMNERLMAMDNDIGKLKEEVKQLRHVPTVIEVVDQSSPNRANQNSPDKTPSWLKVPVDNVNAGEATSKEENKKVEDPEIEDITEQYHKEENAIQSDTESDPRKQAQQKVLKHNLELLSNVLDDGHDRPKMLGPTQKSPFMGNSTVKRIMEPDVAFGCHPSDAAYDPFTPVDAVKLQNLRDFIRVREEQPIGTFDSEVNFYRRLMTRKEEWPEEEKSNYGWVGDQHMVSSMHLLRKRSLRVPTPFRTERIAFLDQWFVALWYIDYKQFAISPPKFLFGEGYEMAFNGTSPDYAQTKKRWIDDVDVVYFFHNINNNHWIACEMDLNKEIIEIYDSIIPENWKKVVDGVRPYAKMVPYWIKAFTPKGKRKGRKLTAFKLHYNKHVPQNVQTGDCGVYAVKFVECLALGYQMDGLSDNTIPEIRLKLAAEIFDEVPDANPQMSDPRPYGQDKVRIPTHATQS